LNGKPIVVLSNNDGSVIARSNEAKALGVPMGAVAYKYDIVFQANGVHVFSANFALYGDMSNRVMNVLKEFSPECEIYSVDEAFLKLKGFEYFDLEEYGRMIKEKVTRCTGIPVSIGIAPTKALSKVANRIAKKYPERTLGSYVMDTDEKRIKALKWLKIEEVLGIGRKHSEKLRNSGVRTGYDFSVLNDTGVVRNMSIIELRLKRDLMGIPTLYLSIEQPKKSIATTRSFERNLLKIEDLTERVTTFAVSCSEKIRKQNSCCNEVRVFIQTNFHRKELEQYSNSITIKLPFPTNSNIEIAKFAVEGLERIFKTGYQYKRAGVVIMDFIPESDVQLSLFENSNPKHRQLMKVIDLVNLSTSQQKVRLASQDMKRIWKMKNLKYSLNITNTINSNKDFCKYILFKH